MAKVITDDNAAFQAFTAATQHAQSQGDRVAGKIAEVDALAAQTAQTRSYAEAAINTLNSSISGAASQAAAQTVTRVDAAIGRTDAAVADALGLSAIAPEHIYTAGEVPGAATDGTHAAQWTGDGVFKRLKRQAGTWVAYGSGLLSLVGLRLRVGYNVMDYAHLRVGDDWAPAFQAMFNEAPVGATVIAPPVDFTIRSGINPSKPYHFVMAGARLLATGNGFLPDAQGKPRYALDLSTRDGNGSLGDNPAHGTNDVRLTGHLPHLVRVGNGDALFRDGSVGLRLNNTYYPDLTLGSILHFHTGFVHDAENLVGTANSARGSSHGRIKLGRFECVRGMVLNGRESNNTAPNNPERWGWVTCNTYYKGSWANPPFPYVGGVLQIPDDHFHVVSYGKDIFWQYGNRLEQPLFEGTGLRALWAEGPQQGNIMEDPLFELPWGHARGIAPFFHGEYANAWQYNGGNVTPEQIEDKARYSYSRTSSYRGVIEYFDGIAAVRQTRSGESSAGTREWYPEGPFTRQYRAYTSAYTSAVPLELDLSSRRNFVIGVQSNVVPGSIKFINPPTLFAFEVEVEFTNETGALIYPTWLPGDGPHYCGHPTPVQGLYRRDRYVLRFEAGATAAPVVVQYSSTNLYQAGTEFPTLTFNHRNGSQRFFHTGEGILYINQDAAWVPVINAATTTRRGTVRVAEAVADVQAAPTAAEFNALLERLRVAGVLSR